jgi:hypothetical protein
MSADTDIERRCEQIVKVALQRHEKYSKAVRAVVDEGRTLILFLEGKPLGHAHHDLPGAKGCPS